MKFQRTIPELWVFHLGDTLILFDKMFGTDLDYVGQYQTRSFRWIKCELSGMQDVLMNSDVFDCFDSMSGIPKLDHGWINHCTQNTQRNLTIFE